jgi:hypothetical protein
MTLLRVLAVLAASAAAVPAVALADPPWRAPLPVDPVSSTTTLLTPQTGGPILVGASSSRSLASPTVVARVQADGSTARRQTLAIAYAKAATFGRAGIVVAGSRPALTSDAAAKAPVVVALGSARGIHAVGTSRALPGSRGQAVSSVGGNPASGTVAVVTASMYGRGAPTRTVWLYRGGRLRRALTFSAGTNARDTAVAVGARGDVLVAWQARRAIYARHLGPSGHAGAAHRLGSGAQSALQARLDDDGRLEVAWQSQRVSEGDAETPATVSYTSAPRGARFAPARVVGGSSLTGTGRYVMRPGVRVRFAGARERAGRAPGAGRRRDVGALRAERRGGLAGRCSLRGLDDARPAHEGRRPPGRLRGLGRRRRLLSFRNAPSAYRRGLPIHCPRGHDRTAARSSRRRTAGSRAALKCQRLITVAACDAR